MGRRDAADSQPDHRDAGRWGGHAGWRRLHRQARWKLAEGPDEAEGHCRQVVGRSAA
jgi:hypothetical protein